MDELIEQFVIEGRELVQQASADLLALERAPDDRARLDGLFRCVHTLKGSAAIFDLAPMGRVLHAAEDLLDAARAGAGRGATGLSRAQNDAMLDVVGRCDDWIEAMAANGGTLPTTAEAESARLLAGLADVTGAPAPGAESDALPGWAVALREAEAHRLAPLIDEGTAVTALRYAPAADCFFLGDDPLALLRAVPDLVVLRIETEPAGAAYDPFRCRLVLTAASTAAPAAVRAPFRFVADQVEFAMPTASARATDDHARPSPGAPPRQRDASQADTLRVPTGRVDELIDGLGELLAAKNTVLALLRRAVAVHPSLAGPLAQAATSLDRQIAEAHQRALRLRMMPLAKAFGRLPRLVRETAATLGKPIEFVIDGEAAEIDRMIADRLFEPLLHLLRNAVDHGIEAPERRARAGKPAKGQVRLSAESVTQGVAITVSDDGAGIDEEHLRAVATARGLIDAAGLDRAGTLELLFRPGFSTAEAVTGVSGRGVGLDAVRAAVVALGGTVTLHSEPGRGTAFRLMLPQRAAITPVMVVRAGGERWGVPVDAISEVVRLRAGSLKPVHGGRAIVHRHRTLPVLGLAGLLGMAEDRNAEGRGGGEELLLLVVRMAGEEVGLAVAGVDGREDVLLRPVAGLLAATPLLQGTAVLGDGGVLMILDLGGLAP